MHVPLGHSFHQRILSTHPGHRFLEFALAPVVCCFVKGSHYLVILVTVVTKKLCANLTLQSSWDLGNSYQVQFGCISPSFLLFMARLGLHRRLHPLGHTHPSVIPNESVFDFSLTSLLIHIALPVSPTVWISACHFRNCHCLNKL